MELHEDLSQIFSGLEMSRRRHSIDRLLPLCLVAIALSVSAQISTGAAARLAAAVSDTQVAAAIPDNRSGQVYPIDIQV